MKLVGGVFEFESRRVRFLSSSSAAQKFGPPRDGLPVAIAAS
jgi:hypothetical protein